MIDSRSDLFFIPGQHAGIPNRPGCYILRDDAGEVLFVGKGANLRVSLDALVGSSDLPRGSQRPHRRYLELRPDLLRRMHSVEIILTHGEEDNIPLTNRLIQRWQPVFNLATFLELGPDTFIYQTRETYPRLMPIGEKRAQKTSASGDLDERATAVYGPFPGGPVRDLLIRMVNEHYQLRTCSPMPKKACMLFEIQLCCAPCESRVLLGDYTQRIENAAQLLTSSTRDLIHGLEQMIEPFERRGETGRARRLREQFHTIQRGFARLPGQTMTTSNLDAVFAANGLAVIVEVRGGALAYVDFWQAPDLDDPAQASAAFASQHYTDPPDRIILAANADTLSLQVELSARCGHAVEINAPDGAWEIQMFDIARINHAFHFARVTK